MVLLRVLWTQCSDQVCARVSSSMSVGSRPTAVLGLDGLHLLEGEEEVGLAAEFVELLVVEVEDGDVADAAVVGRADGKGGGVVGLADDAAG